MEQTSYTDYLDFYQRGPYAPHLEEHRVAGSAPVRLLKVSQPAGEFPDPPTPDLALQLITRGRAKASIDLGAGRKQVFVTPGQMGLLFTNTAGHYIIDGPHELLVTAFPFGRLRFALEEVDPGFSDFDQLHTGLFEDSFIEALCRRLWTESEQGHALGSLFCDSAVLSLGAALLCKAKAGIAPASVRRGGLAPYRLRRVKALLRDRIGEDVTLDELAVAAGLSSSHFARAFRAETGETPWRYLLARRIERAKELLADTDLPLSAVAKDCGFADQSHLGNWFKRLTGATPKQYRCDRRN